MRASRKAATVNTKGRKTNIKTHTLVQVSCELGV